MLRKNYVFCLVLIFASIHVANAQSVSFLYDLKGNREYRSTASKIPESDSLYKSINSETEVPYESIASLKVYPNPTETVLNIEFSAFPYKSAEYKLMDIHGRLVYNSKITSNLTSIDFLSLAKGTYILLVKTDVCHEKYKIIKQ